MVTARLTGPPSLRDRGGELARFCLAPESASYVRWQAGPWAAIGGHGRREQAEAIAHSITDPDSQAGVLSQVCGHWLRSARCDLHPAWQWQSAPPGNGRRRQASAPAHAFHKERPAAR
jgi:hypothetical protein